MPAEQRGIPLFVALTSRYPKSHMGGAPGGVDSLSRNLFPVFDLNDGGSVFASALSLFPIFNVRIIRPIQFLEPGYAIPTGNRFRLHADLPVVTSRTGASYILMPSRCPFFNPRFVSRQRPSGLPCGFPQDDTHRGIYGFRISAPGRGICNRDVFVESRKMHQIPRPFSVVVRTTKSGM